MTWVHSQERHKQHYLHFFDTEPHQVPREDRQPIIVFGEAAWFEGDAPHWESPIQACHLIIVASCASHYLQSIFVGI